MLGKSGLILRRSSTIVFVEGSKEYLKLKWYQVSTAFPAELILGSGCEASTFLCTANLMSPEGALI